MYALSTPDLAREAVSDRLREADHARLVNAVRRTRSDAPAEQPQEPSAAGWIRRFRRFRLAPSL